MTNTSLLPALAILWLVWLAPVQADAACTKILRWNEDPPYSFLKESDSREVTGLDIEIVQEAMRRLGCKIELAEMPWARALEELKNGRIDLVSGAYRTAEREIYAHFSTHGIQSPNVLFFRVEDKDRWHLEHLADIAATDFSLGVQIDVTYSAEYERLKKLPAFEKNLTAVSQRSSLWKMLHRKRIDGVIADELTGLMELQELRLAGKIIPSSLIVSNDPAFFAFSKLTTDENFVADFDKVLQQMQDDGTFSTIRKKYTPP
jgi:polar amino acid transport system substrate-binding protein